MATGFDIYEEDYDKQKAKYRSEALKTDLRLNYRKPRRK